MKYSGKCSTEQLQKFLLLVMGVSFGEIRAVKPEADENLLYLARARWHPFYHGKRWRVDLFAGSYASWPPISIEGKVRGVQGYHPEKIMKIKKISKSGNTLQVSFGCSASENTPIEFPVSIDQLEGKRKSNWFWMWRAVGVDLVPTEG